MQDVANVPRDRCRVAELREAVAQPLPAIGTDHNHEGGVIDIGAALGRAPGHAPGPSKALQVVLRFSVVKRVDEASTKFFADGQILRPSLLEPPQFHHQIMPAPPVVLRFSVGKRIE